jgi:tetratricopeptide (TPR) repeat protein
MLNQLQGRDAPLDSLLSRYQSEPENALLCEQIGLAYTRLNNFEDAAAYFRKAIALNPDRLPARKNLAVVLWFLGRRNESVSLFDALEREAPNDPVSQLYLGLSAYDAKNVEKAAAHFERAGALATDNPEVLPIVTESYIASGRSEAANHLLEQRVASGISDAQTYRWLGHAYDSLMKPEKAFQAYSEAIRLEPASDENYVALAAFSIHHANPAFAREVLERGLKQKPGSPKLLLELGLAWAIQGDFGKGRQFFADANTAESTWSLPLLALGVTDLQTGNAEQAAECFRKAQDLAPDDYRCYYLHATALERSNTNTDPSKRETEIADLRRAIKLDPQHARARVALAQAEVAGGSIKAAEAELRQAIRVEPSDPQAFYRLALVCRRQGKAQEAEQLLQTFERLKQKSHSEENEFVLILKTVSEGVRKN